MRCTPRVWRQRWRFEAVDRADNSRGFLKEYQRRWRQGRGQKMERNYRLKQRFSPAQRATPSFLRAFAVSAVGK